MGYLTRNRDCTYLLIITLNRAVSRLLVNVTLSTHKAILVDKNRYPIKQLRKEPPHPALTLQVDTLLVTIGI